MLNPEARRKIVAAGALTFLGVLLFVAGVAVRDRQAQPNILLISIDSLRADHLHSYGYPRDTSPAIDELARAGVRLKTVLAPTSWTLPSHITLLTGLPPDGGSWDCLGRHDALGAIERICATLVSI
jgi:membrane-anchored protein YejM (alkaline phosphatase superfamily)